MGIQLSKMNKRDGSTHSHTLPPPPRQGSGSVSNSGSGSSTSHHSSSSGSGSNGNGSSKSQPGGEHVVGPGVYLSSYEAACQADPQLRSLDSAFQQRTSRAINSIAVGLDVRALSLDSLREVTECLLEMNQDVVNIILECKKDIWKDPQLYDLVNDYLENSLQSLDFCTALEACLKRALHSQSIILLALQSFEEEHESGPESGNPYTRTLSELAKFKSQGDPFTEDFFNLFQGVYKQQVLMLEKLQTKKRKLDKKVSRMKVWRKVTNVIFVAAFVSVLICSVVAAALTAPPLVTAMAAAAAVPLGSMGKWLNSIWSKCEADLKGQRELIVNMQLGTYLVIKDLDGIRVLADKLQTEIEALMHNAVFAQMGDEAVVIGVAEIKKNVDKFMKTIQDLNDHADKCSRDIRKARAVILRRIINYPSSSSNQGNEADVRLKIINHMEPQQQHNFPQHGRQVIGIMTEEQMQVLQQQIAAFTALQEQLCNWYLSSLSPPPMDPNIVDPNPYSQSKVGRRTRWSPTPEQLVVLEQFGKEIKMNPNKEDLKMLAADLVKHGEITESNVYNWYQNRRARLKKKKAAVQHHHKSNHNMASEMGSKTSSEQLVGDHVSDE